MMLNRVTFFLCCMSVVFFGPCTAFLEVGVSGYLGSTVHHMPDVGWTLVKPWSVTSRKGFFEAAASGGKGFSDSFVTPEPAIYFVALNLHMVNTGDGFLKATLVINGEFHETNGISGVYGNTTLERTLSLSGFLRLYENDVLALYLHGSMGALLRDSTFSVVQISRIGSVPGFHAVLSSDLAIETQKKTRLESWRASGTKGLFSMHSGASPSVGLFCAILEGIHLLTSNINVKSNNQLTRCLLAIVLNSNTTLVQTHSSGAMKYSTGVTGMFYLNRGDCVELRIESMSAGILTVQSGSSYSGLFLGIKRETAPQFSVSLHADNQAGKTAGWNRVENWSISSSQRNFQSQDMILKTTHSTFHSSADGIFLVTALVNTNVSHSLKRSSDYLLVAINDVPIGLTGNSGISAVKMLSSGPSSLSVSGVVWLEKGDTLTVYIHNDVHDRKIIDGFLGVSLVSYDWPGVAATLKESTSLNSQGWTKVTSWKTYNVSGLFSFDNAFFSTNGVYRTSLEGTYFVSCNVIFKGYARGTLSGMIAIDDVIDTGNGLFSLNENPKRYTTLNVAGSIKLRKGQNISVYVASTESSSWRISMETGFSLVLVGAKTLYTPGFFAVKEEEASPSSFCGEIERWRTMAPPFHSFCHNSAQFNSTSGRFKAKEDGFYLISANVLIQHSGLSQINMNISLDGQNSKAPLYTFQPKPSNPPRGAFVSTLTLAGGVRLIEEQYLSIFIEVQCQSVSSWKVLRNSSFSVVMVSRWDSDYAAEFLAKTTKTDNGLSTFNKVHHWEPVFSKNLSASSSSSVDIKSSGLYFIQSTLILKDKRGNATIHSGVCIPKTTIAFNGISASKVSERFKGNFVISAFGVLYLRKGQKIVLCTRSEKTDWYQYIPGSLFSMVRFLAPGQRPGLHQTFQHVRNASVPCERSVIRSVSTAGNQLAYINSNVFNPNPTLPCDKGDFMATLTGTYFISLIFTLEGNVSENVTACVGPRKCEECYVEVFSTLNQQNNNTVGFAGLLDLKKSDLISICLKSQDNSFSLVSATRSVQFLNELELNGTVKLWHRSQSFDSSGWHELLKWKTPSGETLQNISVMHSGIYVLSTNMVLKVAFEGLVGVRLEAIGSAHQEVLSILSSAEAGSSVSFSVAVLVRLNASEAISVSIYTDPNSTFFGNNSTFFATLITDDNQHPCFSLRSKTSRYSGGEWWKGIEQWENVDARCLSPNSEFAKGRFIADMSGVYFAAAVVMVRTSSSLHQTRIIELLLSVNGESANTNALKATKAVAAGSSVVLSLSATVYLEPWQTLYLMIRSSGAGSLEVVSGSTFSVALIEGTKYYKTVAKNVIHFDNGPRIVRHPPPSVSLGDDLGLNISWRCDAVAKDVVTYKWLKNDQTITSSYNLSLTNVQESDSGRYVCLAEYDGIKVFSQAAKLDVFDTRPQFESKEFTASEDSNVSIELMLSALTKRRMPANVSLVIVKGNTNNTFVLSRVASKENVYLINQIPFDYETMKLYQLTLIATNQDTKKTTSANITVIITDVNDNPPIFTSRTNISVEENVANGTVIFQVKATDADYGNNSIITYSLLQSEYGGKFSIDASSGNITVIGNLDRENTSEVTILIQATDGKFSIPTKLFVVITDVNDNPPVFTSRTNISVEENVANGTVIFQVKATDADYGNNSIITYSLLPSEYGGKFSMDASSGNITVIGNLDRENRSEVTLLIQATDGKFSIPAELLVIITDVNDNPPVFTSGSNISVQENVANGTVIFQVKATDGDYGNNSIITYSLLPCEYDGKFSIDASSGNITVIGNLDRENTSEVTLRIQTTDGKFSIPTELFVIITDVNDNPPVFTSRTNISVEENVANGTVIFQVKATDADYGNNSIITYSLLPSEHGGKFSIDASSGNITVIGNLGRENTSEVTLLIQATDGKFSVTTEIFVIITDVNDNPPVFTSRTNISVEENVANGTVIFQVKATDADYGNNSIITYSLLPSEYGEKFSIDASSGNITVIGNLDRENTSEVTLRIQATDGKFSISTGLIVIITDVNDNPPVFTSRTYISVEENVTNGTFIFQVEATDADFGNNSIITYSLLPSEYGGKFSIDASSGNITVIGNLDRENTNEVTLRIQATDGKFLITTEIFITVLDVNEFPPVFDRQSYKKCISETVLVGERIIQVFATDKDSGENRRLFYSIVSGNSDSTFSVNAENGSIVLQKSLDYKMKKNYELRVKASDNGIPSLESFTNVSITVEKECEIKVTLQELPHSTTQQLFRVPASSDADYGSKANITYSIVIENNVEVCSDLVIDRDGGVYSETNLHWGAVCNISVRAMDEIGTHVCFVYLRVVAKTTPSTEQPTGGFPDEGKYALITIAAVLFLLLVILTIWCMKKRRFSSYKVKTTSSFSKGIQNHGTSSEGEESNGRAKMETNV